MAVFLKRQTVARFYHPICGRSFCSTTPIVKKPPVYICKTGSPNVYMASPAAAQHQIDPLTLFSSSGRVKNTCLSGGHFLYISPEKFGHTLPQWNIPEVAFLGRSNVGKSSLINSTMNAKLARSSKQPGRTQQVNYFALFNGGDDIVSPAGATGFLIDLPGYGFAKAPEKEINKWQRNTQNFLLLRRDFGTLKKVYLLVDSRRGPSQIDRDIMGWFDEASIDYTVVVTKADRVGRPQLAKVANEVCMRYANQVLSGFGWQGAFVHLTSSIRGEGISELRESVHVDFCD